MKPIRLELIDGAILIVYFAFVLGIGFVLKRHMRSSTDFFLSGRLIPTWVAGLAFLSANLGAQEVIGMAASGAKYGIMTSHFYWVGRDPGDGFRRSVHDAFLLRIEGALGSGVSQTAFRRKDPRAQRHDLRAHDGFFIGHFDVCHGAAAQSHSRLGF
jgi:hypothetical protein